MNLSIRHSIAKCSSGQGAQTSPRLFAACTARASLLGLAAVVGLAAAQAQTPQPLPYTMTTLAGSSPMSGIAGTQCPNLPSGVRSTDAFGDGCLAVNAVFGGAARGGVQVDAFGNVFVADDTSSIVHVIDPTTGIMTVLAGGAASVCTAASSATASGAVDAAGDGCLAATQTKTASPRGIGLDAYGNVLLGGYGDNAIHLICRTASPNCSAAQIGRMELVAGCVKNTGSNPSGGVGLDNVQAAQTFISAGCAAANGEVDAPRGASGDIYGNIYFADTSSSRTRVVLGPLTSSYFSGTNPLYAALGVYYPALTAGYAYTVANLSGTGTSTGGTPTVKNAACSTTTNSVTYSGIALDTFGDGCPFSISSVNASSGYTSGVATDAAGNMLFTDPGHGLRVFYVTGAGSAGALMTSAIEKNNPGVTPQPGFLYMLWGGGSTALAATPTLGTSTAASDSTIVKLAVAPNGDIYVGDSSKVILFDIKTGYVRQLFASSSNVSAGTYCTGTSGPKSLSAYSDGCPAADSLFSNSSGLGLSLDAQNNLYLFDASSSTKMLVRKVLAQGFAPETLNTAQLQTFEVQVDEPGAGSVAPSVALSAAPDLSVSAPTCNAQNSDGSVDCFATVTATPSAPGARSATLSFAVPLGSDSASGPAAEIALDGTVTGSALAFDNGNITSGAITTPLAPATNTIFASIRPASVAVDGSGNVYTMDTASGHLLEYIPGSGISILPGSLPANPSQLAVDQTGNIFAAGSGTANILELAVTGAPAAPGHALTYTPTSLNYTPLSGTATPQALAVDGAGNVFVADKQGSPANTAIYRLSGSKALQEPQTTVASGFINPVALAVDPSGNLYVADKDAGAVYKLTPGLNSGVPGYVQTTVSIGAGVVPVGLATDAAGDLYVQDRASESILEVPASGATATVYSGLSNPSGIAVDGAGDVYSADLAGTSVVQIVRNSFGYDFGTNQSQTLAGTLTNVGNQPSTGQNPLTNTTNFALAGGAANGCSVSSNMLGPQAAGNACTLSAAFVGAGSGTISDRITYLPAATTIGSLTLTGTLQGTAYATTTTISAPNPSNPSFVVGGGAEVTFNVTVAATSGTPGGTVAVTVDSTTNSYLLNSNGVAAVTVSGLTAGPHTIYAVYATSGSFTGSNSGTPASFTIAQDSTAVAWTPAVTTLQYSAPVGVSVLNATATYNGSPIPGTFVYTANGVEINAASYLPIGSYTLNATFYPNDSIDFASSSITGKTLTVTQASTTAAVGATQMVVASDGTGNYTSVQSAINALPATGGNIYIKPGNYTGFVTVAKPNVSIYGIGGDPTKVILTNEDGAFSPPFLPGQGYGNNGSAGDQGSATMVVARATVNGFTGTPSNFYAEDLSIANTYDTDNTTTSTNALVGGTCTPNQAPRTLAALYNAGVECNSQALAIWITSDQAVLNNVYTASQQDTIYAGSISASGGYPARQYWFRGKVTGDVDYIFGDAAAVFDRTSIYTTFHGSATGTETIEAQNKADQTGGSPDYLSGYIMNSDIFTSQAAGMTSLYFGRPYGKYSTWIMLNSLVDQVNPTGYIEFSNDTNLPTSTYAEYNDLPYIDPATGSPDANGVLYLGSGGSSGSGVNGTRETTSQDPGTPEAANAIKTSLTQVQAQQYYPVAFLGQTVPTSPYNSVTNWDPTSAIGSGANHFALAGASPTVTVGTNVTIVMRPQTPGVGAITNGLYTIPTGSYTLLDTFNNNTATLATGQLDAAGEASFTTASLAPGTHSLTWAYSGDANFAGSASAAYVVTVGQPELETVSTLSKQMDGSYQVIVTVTNNGNATASSVAVTGVTIGAAAASPVPQSLGDLATGASASATFSLPATAGASGSRVVERVAGTYSGGNFGGSQRTVLP